MNKLPFQKILGGVSGFPTINLDLVFTSSKDNGCYMHQIVDNFVFLLFS